RPARAHPRPARRPGRGASRHRCAVAPDRAGRAGRAAVRPTRGAVMSVASYADLARAVRAAPARLGPVRLVAGDGPAGAGKTPFAGRSAVALRPQWVRWMADERAHFAADRTAERADLVVDGAPGVAHDPHTGYVTLDERRWTRRAEGGTIAPEAGTRPRAGWNGEER